MSCRIGAYPKMIGSILYCIEYCNIGDINLQNSTKNIANDAVQLSNRG